jgi:hypothetical protein
MIWPFFDLVGLNLEAQWPAPLFMRPMPNPLIQDWQGQKARKKFRQLYGSSPLGAAFTLTGF